MARKAIDGIQDLIDRTGGPKLKATVTVDQIYAQNQHESLNFQHPRGGRAKYLEAPMFEGYREWFGQFARGLLRRDAEDGWGGVGRSLAREVPKNAPVEFGDLRNSAGLVVRSGGSVVINEPPKQRRLSDQELEAKDYLRAMGLSYR